MCEQPFVAGDLARFESWFRISKKRRSCRNRATWVVSADVLRIHGKSFRSRRVEPDTVTVYGCGVHALSRPDRAPWHPLRFLWARPLPGYVLPAELRPLARRALDVASERSAA